MKRYYNICSRVAELVADQLSTDEIENCARMGLAQSDKIPTRLALQMAAKKIERKTAKKVFDPLAIPFREVNGYDAETDSWFLARFFSAPRIGRKDKEK